MYQVNEDNSIYVTRGDIVHMAVTAEDDGEKYLFQPGDVVRIKVFAKKDCESVVLQKDFPITKVTDTVEIFLDENDTKIGEVISKPTDYWYEVELNPETNPQTIIGYDEDGTKVFKLFPEGRDLTENDPIIQPEDIPVVDEELSPISKRPVENQVVTRALYRLEGAIKGIPSYYITPEMFGAIGDGVADDTEAFQNAIKYCEENNAPLFIQNNTYKVSRVTISDVTNIKIEGVIKASKYIEIKENPHNAYHSNIDIYSILGELRLSGLNSAIVKINKCNALKLFSVDGSNDFTAYSSFYLGDITNLTIHTENSGWINENIFIGGRISNLIIEGSLSPEDNLFIKPMFENATINIANGYRNRFENCRLEGNNTIKCGEGTFGNIFEKTYFTVPELMYAKHQMFDISWNDSGDNVFIRETGTKSVNLISINKYNNPYNLPVVNDRIEPVTVWARLFISDIVPIPNTNFCIEFINPSKKVSVELRFYDDNKNLLNTTDAIKATQFVCNNEGIYSFGSTDVERAMALISPGKGAKYMSITVLGCGEKMSIDSLEVSVSYKENERIQAFIDGFKNPISQ